MGFQGYYKQKDFFQKLHVDWPKFLSRLNGKEQLDKQTLFKPTSRSTNEEGGDENLWELWDRF